MRPLVAVVIACWSCTARVPPRPTGFVIVTLDTTRADRLPAYGFRGVETPALDALAKDGVVFERATTVAPLTLPAHSSLFTGLYPPRHGVRDNAGSLAEPYPTLAGVLASHGFRTAAFVGSVVLSADRGIARGFQIFRDEMKDPASGAPRRRRPGNEVVDEATAWLQTIGDRPFLLWVHLYDVHQPYAPPEPFATRYAADPYAGEIAFADTQMARLVAALGSRGLTRRTAMIVAGDHGESLGEHGEDAHGLFVYQSTLHVPLIVSGPGFAIRRVAEPVSLVDVMPTVLDLAGVPSADSDGVSLTRAVSGRRLPERTIYAESFFPRRFGWSELRSIRDGRFKLIAAPRPELYDLDADPFEQQNLYRERSILARALEARLTPDSAAGPSIGAQMAVDASVRERLASLGYASGAAPLSRATAAAQASSTDPKDHVAAYNENMRRATCGAPCFAADHPIAPQR
jgi:choline-sulfatase